MKTGDVILFAVGLVLATLAAVGWFLRRWLMTSMDSAPVLIIKWIVTLFLSGCVLAFFPMLGPFGPFLAIPFALIMTAMWTPNIGAVMAGWFTAGMDGGKVEVERKPTYSIPIAHRKRGAYAEAIAAIDEQLEEFPDDFELECMKAEILVENLGDLQRGVALMERIGGSGDRPSNHRAYALTQVADWHLKYSKDEAAAREAFENIRAWLPDTDHARKAAQRISHLTGPSAARPQLAGTDDSEGARLQAHLAENPSDSEAREEYARLLAAEFGRVDLAIAELEKGLANSPGSPRDMARWLNLKADYFVQYGDDSVEASSCLQRIIAQHPGTAFAIAAEQRLARLGSERKKHDTRPTIKLGAYRNNLGLPDEMD